MKKIMVFLMILVASCAGAEDWLSVDFAFQMFYIPSKTSENELNYFDKQIYTDYAPYTAIFKIDASIFQFIKIGGSWKTIFENSIDDNFFRFSPGNETFIVYAGIEPVKGITFIYEHKCIHSFYPFSKNSELANDKFGFEIKGSWKS